MKFYFKILLLVAGLLSSCNGTSSSTNVVNSTQGDKTSQTLSTMNSISPQSSSKPSTKPSQPSISLGADAVRYYSSINASQTKETLFNSLSKLINTGFKSISYNGLWDAFKKTDNKGNNIVWDMYGAKDFKFGVDQAGSYSKEGDVYNREHSVPKSWFKEAKPAYSDLFHLYPTDGYVNGRRSNYPFGEVGTATYISKNGSKLGSSSFSGYTGVAFEPIDMYKGDFARTYFYFAVKYKDLNCTNSEGKYVFTASYPKLTTYAINLFKKWSDSDPVSEKEINRNNAVYSLQKNRNPFIDHPEWISQIW